MTAGTPASPLSNRVIAGDPRAIARAISVVEAEGAEGAGLVRELFRHTGRAYLVGVTGPPGAGKSTLVDRLVTELRKRSATVGVLAVDPTSPFTGGAVLGDRLRMQAHASDEGVFIRSMATRGQLGGLSRGTADAALVLDAAGKDFVLIETVGVGQDEVEIVRTADVSVVTLVPGAGDDVQALKAGIMEIADVFVVNKADREGSDRLVTAIEAALSLHAYQPDEWRPPVMTTVATRGEGVPALLETIDRFRAHSTGATGGSAPAAQARRRMRVEQRLRELVSRRFWVRLEGDVVTPAEWARAIDRIAAREVDPYSVADELVTRATKPTVS